MKDTKTIAIVVLVAITTGLGIFSAVNYNNLDGKLGARDKEFQKVKAEGLQGFYLINKQFREEHKSAMQAARSIVEKYQEGTWIEDADRDTLKRTKEELSKNNYLT